MCSPGIVRRAADRLYSGAASATRTAVRLSQRGHTWSHAKHLGRRSRRRGIGHDPSRKEGGGSALALPPPSYIRRTAPANTSLLANAMPFCARLSVVIGRGHPLHAGCRPSDVSPLHVDHVDLRRRRAGEREPEESSDRHVSRARAPPPALLDAPNLVHGIWEHQLC